MEVEPDVHFICLGDLNGRLKTLESHIEMDDNGRMIKEWTEIFGLHHLNLSDKCIGTYTFGEEGGRRSAVDHMIFNNELLGTFKGTLNAGCNLPLKYCISIVLTKEK